MKQRILLTLFASLCALFSFAAGTEINGIHYYLNDNNMTASVTFKGTVYYNSNPYIGDITIPSTVTITYTENNHVYYK